LGAFRKYDFLSDHHKYKNNYDYNLAIHLLNKKIYMSTPALLLVEETTPSSPISTLHYEFYNKTGDITEMLNKNSDIQCIVGRDFVPFGQSQCPSITDYADRVDTLQFLANL